MASASFDKAGYRPGETAVLTVNYADVPDGSVSFTATITPGGGGTPVVLTASSSVEATVTDAVIKVGGVVRTATVAADPAANRITYTFTV